MGLIGWAYNEFKTGWTVREQDALAIDKLDNQGAARIELAQVLFSQAVSPQDYAHAIDVLLYDTALIRLSPEFKDRSTPSIVCESEQRSKSYRSLGEYFLLLQKLDLLKAKGLTPAESRQQQETFEQIRETVK